MTNYIFRKNTPLSKELYRQIKEDSKEIIIPSLKIMALIISVAGLFAMIFEARHFQGYSVPVFVIRLAATIISFFVLVLLYSKHGNKYAIQLVHVLMIVIIASSGYMIYLLPSTLVMNSNILGLIIFTSALFLSWEVKQQIITVVYYNIIFGASIFLSSNKGIFHPDMIETILFVLLLSILSIIGSSVSYRLRLQLVEKSYRVRQSEKKFKSIFDNSAEGIFQSTHDGRFLTVNEALLKILGYKTKEELLKVNITKDLYYDASERWKLISKVKTDGEVKNYIVKLKKKDGKPVVVKVNDKLVRDETGDNFYYEGSMQDITDQVIADQRRREAEELLRIEKEKSDKLAKEAQESNIIKSQFLANMSHEIRTPMNGIIGYLSLIEKQAYENTEEMKQFAASAKDSADVLLDIINNILDLSKIESGKMELNESDFNLSEVINDAITVVSSKAVEKNLKISRSINGGSKTLRGDAPRLRQIFINLLSNAIKFTDEGEVRLSASLEHENDTAVFRFSVEDTGVGISADKLESLFQPFSQIDSSATRKHGGTGLGLAICKEFVSMMGGEINVESEPGKGSKFIFILPFKFGQTIISKSDAPELKKELKPVIDKLESRKNIRILLAEDNLINQKIAVRMLNNGPYEIDTAVSGREALQKLREKHFDIVLMDIQMPDMDGFMVTQEIRKSGSHFSEIPIIAITAHALTGYKEKCLEAGMNEYVTKPIVAEDLKEKINLILHLEQKEDKVEAPVPDQESNSIFDFNLLNSMSLGEAGFQGELLNTFLDDITKRADILETHLRELNYDQICNEAHTIKGASSSIGAVQIASHALAVEISAKSHDINNALRHFLNLTTAVGETKDLLKNKGMIR